VINGEVVGYRTMDVLDLRDLNRATLTRQCLLERSTDDVASVIRRVGGMQAQTPANPMVGLWSRIVGFERAQLLAAVDDGEVVRGTTLRGTLHLHQVDEYRELRMSLQPMLDVLVQSVRCRARDQDLEPAIELGRELLRQGPKTIGELKQAFRDRFPKSEAQALGTLVRYRMQLLMVPDPQQPNGYPNVAKFARWQDVLDGELQPGGQPELVLRRFLEVLGPGSVRDAQVWSGVRGLTPIARGLLDRGELVEVGGPDGGVLLDLPGAPRPDGDTEAPVRFLPMWDNLLLSHADRSRVIDATHKAFLASKNGMPPATFLVDGFARGTWKLERDELQLSPFGRLTRADRSALTDEAEALVAFLRPDSNARVVRFT
jgi:hypothetical protein